MEPLLALSVGQDLPDGEWERTVTQHMQQCPACRERRQALAMSRSVLQDAQPVARIRGGLWPRVAMRITSSNRRPLAHFNVWVPTAVAALACTVLVTVAAVEIQKKVSPQTPIMVRSLSAPSRNLFVSDPAFSKSHGQLIDAEDIAAWQQTQGDTPRPVRYQPDP